MRVVLDVLVLEGFLLWSHGVTIYAGFVSTGWRGSVGLVGSSQNQEFHISSKPMTINDPNNLKPKTQPYRTSIPKPRGKAIQTHR